MDFIPDTLKLGRCAMTGRIYQYRDFDIAIDVRPFAASANTPVPELTGYLSHVRLIGKAGRDDLPALTVLDKSGRLFSGLPEAMLASRFAGEAAIDALLARADRTPERECA